MVDIEKKREITVHERSLQREKFLIILITFCNDNNIKDMILFLFEDFFITLKVSCPSSTLKGKV